ncbi:MAG: hypothetical protein L0229_05860 [Blastocatellia bacterium]|nr:hypothetical protein [Blastocatellia bacterium]
MNGDELQQVDMPRRINSPLKGMELIDTFNAARILFPDEALNGNHRKRVQRRIQRLCERGVLEYFRVGHEYLIVKKSIYDYIDENHNRPFGRDPD